MGPHAIWGPLLSGALGFLGLHAFREIQGPALFWDRGPQAKGYWFMGYNDLCVFKIYYALY